MKKKILIVSNNSWSLYKFRYDYINKLNKQFKFTLFTPDNEYSKKFKNFKFIYLKKKQSIFIKLYNLISKENFDEILVYSFKCNFC